MSDPIEIGLDLDKHFLPSWAQQPAGGNDYEKYQGGDDRRGSDRRGPRDRPPRRDNRGPGGGGGGPGGPGGPRGPRGDSRGRPGGRGPGGGGLRWDREDNRGGGRRPDAPREIPLPPIDVSLSPDSAGVASLARQIKLSGRAYPLFEVASLIVQKPDRYEITFRTQRSKEGAVAQPLFECSLDHTVWLGESEATKYVLKNHFDTFYQTAKQPCDPPKGVWTLVAQCGFTGEVLGPPNFHGYQEKLRKLHSERFNRMPFDAYKARVRFVKDEAVVKQWLESQSSRFEYTTLNVPEPRTLHSLDEVETHFRETHAPNVIRQVDSFTLKPGDSRPRLPEGLFSLMRQLVDKERRFPIRTATALSSYFAHAGLQFFKRDKSIVHVSVARPHYLDLETTPVRDLTKKIVEYILAHPKSNRKELIETLAPTPAPESTPAPAAPAAAPSETAAPAAEAPSADAAQSAPAGDAPAPSATAPAEAAPAAPAPSGPTAEQSAIIAELHWLVHQGHVIEFANGILECAKKPVEKPRPAPKEVGLLPVPSANPALVGIDFPLAGV